MDDVRYAFRQLRTHPAFAAVAVMTLAVGIGAAAAMFGLIQGVLLSPPPYADPDRLVLVTPVRIDGQPYDRGATAGQWLAWRRARAIERTAMYRWTFNFLVRGDGSRSLGGMVVTRDCFDVLGVTPADRPHLHRRRSRPARRGGRPTAIILGYDLWQREFGGDRDIIGKAVTLSRMPAPLPVVGVMPPGLRFLPDAGAAAEPNYDVDAKVDFWLAMTPDETQPTRGAGNVIARLRPGRDRRRGAGGGRRDVRGDRRGRPRLAGLTATARAGARRAERATASGCWCRCSARSGCCSSSPAPTSAACCWPAACSASRNTRRGRQSAPAAARLFRLVLIEAVALALTAAVLGAGIAYGIVARPARPSAVRRCRGPTPSRWAGPCCSSAALAALAAGIVAGLLPAVRASWGDRFTMLKGTRTTRRPRRAPPARPASPPSRWCSRCPCWPARRCCCAPRRSSIGVHPGYETERILAMTVTHVGARDQRRAFHDRRWKASRPFPASATPPSPGACR